MPELDGIEAVRRIRALPGSSAIRIVAVTAQPVYQAKNALAAGCNKVLTKPLDLLMLTGGVNEYLSV